MKLKFFLTFLIFLTSNCLLKAQAQSCVMCEYTMFGGSFCNTYYSDIGFEACGCGVGCQCYGSCFFGVLVATVDINSNDLDLKNIEVPKTGLVVQVDYNYEFKSKLIKKEYKLGDQKINIYLNERYAFYEIDENKFIIYPNNPNGIKIYSKCNDEYLATLTI